MGGSDERGTGEAGRRGESGPGTPVPDRRGRCAYRRGYPLRRKRCGSEAVPRPRRTRGPEGLRGGRPRGCPAPAAGGVRRDGGRRRGVRPVGGRLRLLPAGGVRRRAGDHRIRAEILRGVGQGLRKILRRRGGRVAGKLLSALAVAAILAGAYLLALDLSPRTLLSPRGSGRAARGDGPQIILRGVEMIGESR